MKYLSCKLCAVTLTSFLLFFFSLSTKSQTPGMIFDPITPTPGTNALDPDKNGWISISSSGFILNDESESEIPYLPMIFPMSEPDSDLGPGPDCGFTDFVQQAVGIEDAGQYYLSPANNFLFRLRMSKALPNSKSYSILIDTDGKFGPSGPNKDNGYLLGNPGFEIEIVLATNFGVFVYNVDDTDNPGAPVVSYLGHTNYQKAIALSNECGDPDYFLDFFVDFDDLMAAPFNLLTTTPLRMVLIDNMAANKSTIAQPSSASDLGGMDDCSGNLFACMDEIIDNYTPCPPNTECPDRSECPSVTGSIPAGVDSVYGTTTHAAGTLITLYINGSPDLTTTSFADGTWKIKNINPVLSPGDIIGASATAAGMGESENNCGNITVAVTCTRALDAGLSSECTPKKGFTGSAGSAVSGAVVKIYNEANVLLDPNAGSIYAAGTITANTDGSWIWKCNGSNACAAGANNCISAGSYKLTQTVSGQCESDPIYICIGGVAQTAI